VPLIYLNSLPQAPHAISEKARTKLKNDVILVVPNTASQVLQTLAFL
jgi:hypothetical protein